MKKKIIGLSMLLVVLLLGLYTTSYANDYREFTEVDIKNFLYKSYKSAGHTDVEVEQAIQQHQDSKHIEDIVSALNTYRFCFITRETGNVSGNFVHVYCYNATNVHPYKYGSSIPFKNGTSGLAFSIYYNGTYSSGSYIYGVGESDFNIIFIGDNVYAGSRDNTIVYAAGYYAPNDLFDGPYEDRKELTILPKENTSAIEIGEFESCYLYETQKSGDMLIGTLVVPEEYTINECNIDNQYYRFETWITRQVANTIQNDYIYIGDKTQLDGYATYELYLNNNRIWNNTIYEVYYGDSKKEFTQWAFISFYITDEHTVITNGELNYTATFSGDYKDLYDEENATRNRDIPIQNISNVIRDMNDSIEILTGQKSGEEVESFFKNMYDNLFTMNTDEAQELLETFYNEMEIPLESGEMAAINEFTNILQGQADDFIISWEDVYTPSLAGATPTKIIERGRINFSEEVRNNEALQDAKGYLNVIVSTALLFVLMFNYSDTIMKLLGTTNRFIDDEEVVYEVRNITDEQPMLPPPGASMPTWTGTDQVYWYNQYRKWRGRNNGS